MTRALRVQVLPVLFGSTLALGIVGLMSMQQGPSDILQHVRVEYGPHPRDMVQIREGTLYVVPPGRIFVLTGLGTDVWTGSGVPIAVLSVNGQDEVTAGFSSNSTGEAEGSTVAHVPSGLTASPGSSLNVYAGGLNHGRAWGYLAEQ
jgi:hypothetical protein